LQAINDMHNTVAAFNICRDNSGGLVVVTVTAVSDLATENLPFSIVISCCGEVSE
jgi:hypothetical protein